MFPDYVERVMEFYQKKKETNDLSMHLSMPTPAQIRDECVIVCNKRFERKDEKALADFFGQNDGIKAYLKAIENFDVDKFKPLIHFLKGKTNKTDVKNIELLAWLIDFEDRPFQLGKKYPPADGRHTGTGSGELPLDNEGTRKKDEPIITGISMPMPQSPPAKLKDWKKIGIVAAIVLLLGLGVYIIWSNVTASGLTGQEACMYWDEDHYQPVSCSKKMNNKLVIALDSGRLSNFKKITRPDTITQYSIGKIWYIKRDRGIEFYTDSGTHPVNTLLKLRPITAYIINRHISEAGE